MKLAANLIYVQYAKNATDITRILSNPVAPVAPENIFCVQASMWQTLAEGHLQEKFTENPKAYMLVLNAEQFFSELSKL